MDDFLFISRVFEFEESTAKSALIKITALELNKVSQNNPPTEYRIEEGDSIAASLVGTPVYYGTNIFGKHDRSNRAIGQVEDAQSLGNIIFAWVRVKDQDLIRKIKNGAKFLFSVGGIARFAEITKKAGKTVIKMIGAKCNHLQMVDVATKVGFPNAKIEELVEIDETVLLTGSDQADEMIERAIEDSIPFLINLGLN